MSIWRSPDYDKQPSQSGDVAPHAEPSRPFDRGAEFVARVMRARREVRADLATVPLDDLRTAIWAHGYDVIRNVFLDGEPELPPWPEVKP